MIKTFKDLIVWKKAHQLVLEIYKTSRQFPKEEIYGLTDDMRRASRSVPTNIVEGYARKGYKDALNFFNRSEASLEELKYQTLCALDLEYLDALKYSFLVKLEEEVGRLLNSWIKTFHPRNDR